jgi:superfamily II DNA or RNA helicase
MQLRDYQQTLADDIRQAFRDGHKAPLAVAPTGAGKTVLFSFIARNASARGNTVWILVHRAELINQTSKTLRNVGVEHGLIAAGKTPDPHKMVQVASVQTVVNRTVSRPPDIIIIDEAHHACAGSWLKIICKYPDARIIGFTATPERLDGKGLGDIFDTMVLGPETKTLIQRGFLCPPIYYVPPSTVDMSGVHTRCGDFAANEVAERVDKPRITGDAVDHYRRICSGQPALAFCANIKHAEHVAEAFRAAGYRWKVLAGKMTQSDRDGMIEGLANGSLHGLSTCEIVSEGFDLPVCSVAILLRPTQSLSLHLQQIGRPLRTAPDKPRAYIIDHVGNIDRHKLAETSREWSLTGRADRKKREKETPSIEVRQCPECYCCHEPAPVCPSCGHAYVAKERKIEEIAGTLELAAGLVDEHNRRCVCGDIHSRWAHTCPKCAHVHDEKAARNAEQGRANTLAGLVALGAARGYKNPQTWATKVWESRQAKRNKIYA